MDTQVGHLHCCYRAAGAGAGSAPGRLDRVARERLPACLAAALGRALGDDPTVYVLRHVEDRLVLRLAPTTSDDQLAQQWAGHLAGAVLRRIVHDPAEQCVRFDDQADYVAAFAADLLQGRAWERWFYFSFAALRPLGTAAALRAALLDQRANLPAILAALRRRGALDQLLLALPAGDLRELWAAIRAPAGGGDSLRPLFMAALRLLDRLGLAGVARPGGELLLQRYLATSPEPASWGDRSSLAAAFLAAFRHLLGQSWACAPGSTAAGAALPLLERELGELGWLDLAQARAGLQRALAGEPPAPADQPDMAALRPLFAAALHLAEQLGFWQGATPASEHLFHDYLRAAPAPPSWRDRGALTEAVIDALRFLLSRAAPGPASGWALSPDTLDMALAPLGWLDREQLRASLAQAVRQLYGEGQPAPEPIDTLALSDALLLIGGLGLGLRPLPPAAQLLREWPAAEQAWLAGGEPGSWLVALVQLLADRGYLAQEPAPRRAALERLAEALALNPRLNTPAAEAALATWLAVPPEALPGATGDAPEIGAWRAGPRRPGHLAGLRPEAGLTPHQRELLADLAEALREEIGRLDRREADSAGNMLRLYAAVIARSARWAGDAAAPGMVRLLLGAWRLLTNSSAPAEALRLLAAGDALALLPTDQHPGAGELLGAAAQLGAPMLGLVALLLGGAAGEPPGYAPAAPSAEPAASDLRGGRLVQVGKSSISDGRAAEEEQPGAFSPFVIGRSSPQPETNFSKAELAGPGPAGTIAGAWRAAEQRPPTVPASGTSQAVASECAGVYLLLRAMLDLRLPALVAQAGWPPEGALSPLSAAVLALGLRLGGSPALVADQIDPGLALLAGLDAPPALEALRAAWAATDAPAHRRMQLALLRTLAARRLLVGAALHLHLIDADAGAPALVAGDASGRGWPLGQILAPADSLAAVTAGWLDDWEHATGARPQLVADAAALAEPGEHEQSRRGVAATMQALAANALGLPEVDLALALAANALVRAWAHWLPRLGGSSTPYLLDQLIRRPGWVAADSSQVTVILTSRAADLVIEQAGYFADLEHVPWLGRRRVRFRRLP